LVPVVVVGVVEVDVGLVGELPHPNATAAPAAPMAPMSSRRLIFLLCILPFLVKRSRVRPGY